MSSLEFQYCKFQDQVEFDWEGRQCTISDVVYCFQSRGCYFIVSWMSVKSKALRSMLTISV